MKLTLAGVRKFLAALTGAVGVALSLGFLPDPWDKWIPGGLSVLTAFVVYYVPNTDPAPKLIEGTNQTYLPDPGHTADHK